MDELVAAGPSREHRLRRTAAVPLLVVVIPWRRDTIDKDVDLLAEPRRVPLEADPLLERKQLVEAPTLDVGRDVIGQLRGGRAGPRRVGGGEDLVVSDGLKQAKGRFEGRLGLSAEADDDV